MRILISTVGIALAAMLATVGDVQAQVALPDCPEGQRRANPKDVTAPCITPYRVEVVSVAHRFTPVSHIDLMETYCKTEVVAKLAEGWVLPSPVYVSRGVYVYWRHEQTESPEAGGLVILRSRHIPVDVSAADVWLDYEENERHFVLYASASSADSVPRPFEVDFGGGREWDGDTKFTLTMPVDEFYGWEPRAIKCQAEAWQGHLTLKHAAAEAAREAAQAAQNTIAETTAAAEEERAKVTASTSERIDAARLESEKRVTTTEARELAVVEAMIQASIKVAAEITQIRIDRATARLESLERTATWLRDAAATDIDEWNTYYAEVEQAAIERVEALQVEAAAALEEVQQIQDSLAQDLAASQARQQALTLQLQSQGGVSIEDLQIMRQNAVDWVETIDGLIEEAKAESAGE